MREIKRFGIADIHFDDIFDIGIDIFHQTQFGFTMLDDEALAELQDDNAEGIYKLYIADELRLMLRFNLRGERNVVAENDIIDELFKSKTAMVEELLSPDNRWDICSAESRSVYLKVELSRVVKQYNRKTLGIVDNITMCDYLINLIAEARGVEFEYEHDKRWRTLESQSVGKLQGQTVAIDDLLYYIKFLIDDETTLGYDRNIFKENKVKFERQGIKEVSLTPSDCKEKIKSLILLQEI